MQVRILSAIVLSITLIIGATLTKGKGAEPVTQGVVSVEESSTQATPNTPDSVANLENPVSKSEEEKLTTTDLVSRQLFSDYLNLASAGEATDESISALAEKYASGLSNLIESKKLTLLDLITVSDNKDVVSKYYDSLSQIMSEHDKKIDSIMTQDTAGEDILSSSKKIELVYAQTVFALKNLVVPKSIAELHLKLLNSLSANTEAMHYVSLIDEDPLAAFSGITAFNNNLKDESSFFAEINSFIQNYGI